MSLTKGPSKILLACLACVALSQWRVCGEEAPADPCLSDSNQTGSPNVETASYVYRFRSPEYLTYFYAAGEAEKERLIWEQGALWKYDRVAWGACSAGSDPNLRPVSRFWSDKLFAQYYAITGIWTEVPQDPWGDWQDQGIAFYAFPEGLQPSGAWPVYRLWSSSLGYPFYTASAEERDRLLGGENPEWTDGGVAWYVRPFEPSPQPRVVKEPYLLRPGADSMTVAWQTDLPCRGRISYGRQSPSEFSAEDSNVAGLHVITLTGLEPNSPYVYSLSSGNVPGPEGTFRTSPGTPRSFRFVVYGDTRSYPEDHAAVIRGIVDSRPEVVFHLGDLVADGTDYDSCRTPVHRSGRSVVAAPVPRRRNAPREPGR